MDSSRGPDHAAQLERALRIARTAAQLPEARRTIELRQTIADTAFGAPDQVEELAWRIYRSGDL